MTAPNIESGQTPPRPARGRPWWRAILFCLPAFLTLGLPGIVLWLGGELTPPEKAVALQQAHRLVLHGAEFTNTVIYEKVRAVAQRDPAILAMGTSRVLQFRTGFFKPGTSFYNCGSCIQRVQHLREFLHALPAANHPRILIVGVEKAWFNEKSGYSFYTPGWFDDQVHHYPDPVEVYRANCWSTWQQLATGQLNLARIASGSGLGDRIGLTALTYEQGYRNDGSYLYRDYFHDMSDPRHPDYHFKRGIHLIESNIIPFERGNDVFASSLTEMTAFLDECRERDIMVIGFLPPYPHAICARLEAPGERYGSWLKVASAVAPLFARRGFEFYDFSDFTDLGAGDEEAVDSFHGSEKVYVRLMLKMLHAGSVLGRYADAAVLESDLQRASKNWDIVGREP